MFLFKLSCRTGVEIYILIGSHVQPQHQKVQHQYLRVQPHVGKYQLLAKEGPLSALDATFRPRRAFRRPERVLCWPGHPFSALESPSSA